jgi:hypothetical protein
VSNGTPLARRQRGDWLTKQRCLVKLARPLDGGGERLVELDDDIASHRPPDILDDQEEQHVDVVEIDNHEWTRLLLPKFLCLASLLGL